LAIPLSFPSSSNDLRLYIHSPEMPFDIRDKEERNKGSEEG
jgi:hypothetical protein